MRASLVCILPALGCTKYEQEKKSVKKDKNSKKTTKFNRRIFFFSLTSIIDSPSHCFLSYFFLVLRFRFAEAEKRVHTHVMFKLPVRAGFKIHTGTVVIESLLLAQNSRIAHLFVKSIKFQSMSSITVE